MTTTKEKWDAYEQALKENIATHKPEDPVKDKVFDKIIKSLVRRQENGRT